MTDSIPILASQAATLNVFGSVAFVGGFVAVFLFLMFWLSYEGRRRSRIATGVASALLLATAVTLLVSGLNVKQEADIRQAESISQAWGLTRSDAATLLRSAQTVRSDDAGAYVQLDGRTQKVSLQSQDGRYLLVRDHSEAVPLDR